MSWTLTTKHTFINEEVIQRIHHNKLYATLCCVQYMLDQIEPKNNFSGKLKKLLLKSPMEQEKEMGFPTDWQNDPMWNK